MIFKNYFLIGILFISLSNTAQKAVKMKPTRHVAVTIPEPSDICYDSKTDTFFIVSDAGGLFETDKNCKVLRKKPQDGADFEAVSSDGTFVYAVDESNRTIYKYDIQTLQLVKKFVIPYSGARNKGYESFSFDKAKKKGKGLSGTKPSFLKAIIPIFSGPWKGMLPGYGQIDTVAHCGHSLLGDFIWSLNYTDAETYWVILRAQWNKGQEATQKNMAIIKKKLPVLLLGIHPDTGSEFINWILKKWCDKETKRRS